MDILFRNIYVLIVLLLVILIIMFTNAMKTYI